MWGRIGAGRTVSFDYTVIATTTPSSPYLRLQPATAEYLPSEDIKTPQVRSQETRRGRLREPPREAKRPSEGGLRFNEAQIARDPQKLAERL